LAEGDIGGLILTMNSIIVAGDPGPDLDWHRCLEAEFTEDASLFSVPTL
jgi:hypothetical protein